MTEQIPSGTEAGTGLRTREVRLGLAANSAQFGLLVAAEPGQEPPGHLWRWELEPIDAGHTRVTHTYDWTRLGDERRLPRARATSADRLQASLEHLAALAEQVEPQD